MQLGYSTWGMPDEPVVELVPRLARMGYEGIELTVLPDYRTALESLGTSERRLIRHLLTEHGLTLTAIAAHSSLVDAELREAGIARLRGAVELARELTPDAPPPINTTVGGQPGDWAQVQSRVVDEVAGLAEFAAGHGVALAIEPHAGHALDDAPKMLWLIRQVDRPNVRVNTDYSHFLAQGQTVEESVVPLVPWTVHTHVKGARGRAPNHEYLTPGEDDFDYASYLRVMYDAGYRGFQTVEISKRVQARPGYEPYAHAQLAYDTLAAAFERAGIKRGGDPGGWVNRGSAGR